MVEEVQPQSVPEQSVETKPDPVTELANRLQAMEGQLKNLERINSKKEDENRRLRESLENRDVEQATMKAALTLLSSRTGQTEDDLETEIRQNSPNLAKQFESLVDGERKKRQQERQAETVSSYQARTAELGLTEADKEYWAIFGAVAAGKFDKADKILEDVTEAKKPKQEKPVETKPKVEDVEEAARKLLEERGQLRTERPQPAAVTSGTTWTMGQIRKMSTQEYAKNFPNGMVDISRLISEGKLDVNK